MIGWNHGKMGPLEEQRSSGKQVTQHLKHNNGNDNQASDEIIMTTHHQRLSHSTLQAFGLSR